MKLKNNSKNTYTRTNSYYQILALILVAVMAVILLSGCQSTDTLSSDSDKPIVAVSVPPQSFFVNRIADDTVETITLIPPGYSPENYQPKPSEIEKLSRAKVYFTTDVPTEEANILPSLKDLSGDIKIVDMFDIIADKYKVLTFDLYDDSLDEVLLHEEENHDAQDSEEGHDHSGADPHIWMSPKRAMMMAEIVYNELVIISPENEEMYKTNLNSIISELEDVDRYIKDTLSDKTNKSFIIYHPSLGYFADDYGIKMLAIEENGKETTAKNLERIIDFAKSSDIKVVFYQTEIDSSQAKVIASEINGSVVGINPLSEEYISNLKQLVDVLKDNLK